MKKYLLLALILLFGFGCSKKASYNSIKEQAVMGKRETRKRIKNRHKVAMMDKTNCPPVKKNRKEKRLVKKEGKKQQQDSSE